MNKKLYTTLFILTFALGVNADNAFKPGQTWKDVNGSAINAHGGCIQYSNGVYYWFGENRSGGNSAGVSCYSSTDLYNWKRLSLAVTPTGTKTDANKDIASGRNLERPKVIYNSKTGKWVMWCHWEDGTSYNEAKVAVLQADKVEGPYKLIDVFRPNNHDSRDQTLFLDTDGNAYHVYSTNMNSNTNCELLSDDYLTPTAQVNIQLTGRRYEAASLFKVGDTYYGLFSGCTGWSANPGRYMWTTDIMGSWNAPADFTASDGSTGINFCVDNGLTNSYSSQPAYVIPVQGHDKCFIYYGDRWNSSNIQSSTYVWLPLSVRSGYPTVTWHDSWDLSVFDNMYQFKRAANLTDGMEFYLLEKYSNRFVSRPKTSLTLQDDGDNNVCYIMHATDTPYMFKIENKGTGKYMQSMFGTIRWSDPKDDDAQTWNLQLQEDGYYKIVNKGDGTVLSVSGNSTQAGTNIYLNEKADSKIHQSFGVYFDSKAHPDYKEADMWAADYVEKNRELIKTITGIKSIQTNNDASSRLAFVSGSLHITCTSGEKAAITVYALGSGMQMFHSVISATSDSSLPLSSILPQGAYLVKVTQNGQLQKLKVVI